MTGLRWSQHLLYAALLAGAYALGRWQSVSPAPAAAPAVSASVAPMPVQASAPLISPVAPAPKSPPAAAGTNVDADEALQMGLRATSLTQKEIEQQMRGLSGEAARQYAIGLGRGLAATKTPLILLKLCQGFAPVMRAEVLRGASLEWIERTARVDAETKADLLEQLKGLDFSRGARDATFTELLTEGKVSSDILSAWMSAAASGPQRAVSLSSMATVQSNTSADFWFRQTQGWTDWERERFAKEALSAWAFREPDAAWRWVQANPALATQEGMKSVLGNVKDDDLNRMLPGVRDPAQRVAVIEELARRRAMTDTEAAVRWAEALPTEAEREAAQGAIYDAAPRGIGAILNTEDGFPVIAGVTANSAAQTAGMMKGDRLVELIGADGTKHSLHGEPMGTVVNYIRGEPGTTVRLRVLRTGADGRPTEMWINVTRQQLMFKEKPGSRDLRGPR